MNPRASSSPIGRSASLLGLLLGCLPAGSFAANTAHFAEVQDAIPDQRAHFEAMDAPTFVHIVPLDVNHDGLGDLVMHYWANAVGTNPPSNVPCKNRLVIVVQQANHTFLDQTATVLTGPADLGACSAERRVVDVNEDGWPDIVYATSQEDGRDTADAWKMNAPITALVSRPGNKYAIETFGTPAWNHLVGIGYDAQGKVVVGSGFFFGTGSAVHQRQANGTWSNVSSAFPALEANAFSLFNLTSATGPSDFLIRQATYPDAYSVAGAWRDAGNVWHTVPNLEVLPTIGTLTLITWQGNPFTASVASLDGAAVTSGAFLDSCQFRWAPGTPPLTILKLSTRVIPGGYTGPDQVVNESDLLFQTRLVAFRLVDGAIQRVPLPITHERQDEREARFFDCKDIDGDGDDDIAVYPFHDYGYPVVYLNNGNGSLTGVGYAPYPATAEGWGWAGSSLLHDFDGDGRLDLLTWPATGWTAWFNNDVTFHFYLGLDALRPQDLILASGFE